jgi:hypothetical protein
MYNGDRRRECEEIDLRTTRNQSVLRRYSSRTQKAQPRRKYMITDIFLKLPSTHSEFVTHCNLPSVAGNGTLSKII